MPMIGRWSATMEPEQKNVLVLFDVDGTLSEPRKKMEAPMKERLHYLRSQVMMGIVSGSNEVKLREQLGDVMDDFDFLFPENGMVAYEQGQLVQETSMLELIGESLYNDLVSFILLYLGQLRIPIKRGTFVEMRKGMLNVSPIGRACTQEERDAFEVYDKEHKVRETMVAVLKQQFAGAPLDFAIGGQISMDIYPTGSDKTFCLNYLPSHEWKAIHFFGDKTDKGGNDHTIYNDARTVGHSVGTHGPARTIAMLNEVFPIKPDIHRKMEEKRPLKE